MSSIFPHPLLKEGRTLLFTGDGKGKTTAAAGLTLRLLAAGMHVYFGQFMKARPSGEIEMLMRCAPERFTHETFGEWTFVHGVPGESAKTCARIGYEKIMAALQSEKYNAIIADELAYAVSFKLIDEAAFSALLDARPRGVELVITGRINHPEHFAQIDLISTIQATRHYFEKGVTARRGIEF